jgi:tetratricopeptide (TPR) repeat protein
MNNILPCKANYVIKTTSRFLTLMIACAFTMLSQGQQAKGPVQLADQYYAAGEYYTAANLYEQYLHPSKKQKTTNEFPLNIKAKRTAAPATTNISRTDILYKQAESYRLANYWQQAAAAYKECIEKDPSG